MARDGGPYPLSHQFPAHRQPGLALEREAHRGDASHGSAKPLPGEQQRDRAAADQQLPQPVEPGNELRGAFAAGRVRTLAQIEGHGVHQTAAREPPGQLDCLQGRCRSHDQQPFQLDSQPLGGGSIQAPGRIDPGHDATRLLGSRQ